MGWKEYMRVVKLKHEKALRDAGRRPVDIQIGSARTRSKREIILNET